MTALPDAMEPVARHLLGDPNTRLSTAAELRYGTNGSLSIDLNSGTFYDHEAGVGGGVLDLIKREAGYDGAAAINYILDALGIEIDGFERRNDTTADRRQLRPRPARIRAR